MDGARRQIYQRSTLYGRLVSILVLMDGARRQWTDVCFAAGQRCFNPCFDGWGSPTGVSDSNAIEDILFQSLF